MPRLATLALVVAPIAALPIAFAPAVAQPSGSLAQVSSHLKALTTMVADFQQTDRNGRTITGTLTLKRPGKIRFQYQKGYPVLIVGDGKALNMIDYEVRQVSRWPIGNSPLGVLLDPTKDLSRIGTVIRDDAQAIVVRARDPKRPEYGTIIITFTRSAAAPAGLMLRGWTTDDAQSNRTTVTLANQRFNVAVADDSFRWADPRRGPKG